VRLRTQILAFLLLFGLGPLFATLALTAPLVVGSLELFYHKAHLQNLRADFRDLDQHIASRMEMVRLLAKLPEGELLVDAPGRLAREVRERLQEHYADAVNRILYDQQDIVQVLFVDRGGAPRFALERDRRSLRILADPKQGEAPGRDFLDAGLQLEPGGVLISPVSVNAEAGARDPRRFMVLRLVSPLTSLKTPAEASPGTHHPPGAVVIDVDVGGLAEAYPKTYWVMNDGSVLRYGGIQGPPAAAFAEFPGLEEIFARGELGLWKGSDQAQVLWVPLLATERSGPLWVGRQVDASPLSQFLEALEIRAAVVILPLIAILVVLAHQLAGRAGRFGRELTEGIARLLREDAPVQFAWGGPRELRDLAVGLTRLAETHAANARALRRHARELEESNRYKSQFLANVSHELRTPLNSILLLSKLLAQESGADLSPEAARQARVIHDAGQDLAALIDNILDLARIEAGRITVHLEASELEPLLEGLAELVRPQTDAKDLTLEVEVEDDAPLTVTTDVDKLRQVLKNFLSNAVKFTERGGVRLRLGRNHGEDAAERPVRIDVADTGIGIPADKHELIFEAFTQADGSTSRRFGGSGLGLTISRGLAEALGGRIELASRPGEGTVFSLLLPLEPREAAAGVEQVRRVRAPPRDQPAPALPAADFRGRRVLLVDDDVGDLLTVTPLLERWGVAVLAVGDAAEALEVLHEDGGFDAVLAEVHDPGAAGDDTIGRVRGAAPFMSLPIIALTEGSDDEVRTRALAAGAQDCVRKPIDPIALRDALGRVLAAGGTPRKAATPEPA
jgi:signal transduction histidine kinase